MDKEKLYNALNKIWYSYSMCECIPELELIQNYIEDSEPIKHGRWIEQEHFLTNGDNFNVPYSIYVCSNCGLEIHPYVHYKYVKAIYTNCPVCTARMDGGEG